MKAVVLDIQADADRAILWHQDGLHLLDQRLLPHQEVFVHCDSAGEAAEAIRSMVVRGAPAIGITAAYAVVLAAREAYRSHGPEWRSGLGEDLRKLRESRPTAVNLFWALEEMQQRMDRLGEGDPGPELLAAARAMHEADRVDNRRMGEFGASLIKGVTSVITHCNAGGLATGGFGTALGVIRASYAQGKIERVFADETRPWLQGARLTAWELTRDGIPVSLMADGAAAARMAAGGIGWIIVGADRIAANGDVANKIGTYALALAARYHGVGFMVAAPTSTIDPRTPGGHQIPIEQRAAGEVLACAERQIAPAAADAWNPVFDVTPAALIDAIVTERGIIMAPDETKIAEHLGVL